MPTKVHLVKTVVFPVVMYGCESWTVKKVEPWKTDASVLKKILESPLDCKEINPVKPKGHQSWIFIGRIDAEAADPILWPSDVKNWLTGKDPYAGKGWRQEERRWQRMRWLDSITDGWTWVWVSSWSWWWTGRPGVLQFMSRKESDMTEQLNWTELKCIAPS